MPSKYQVITEMEAEHLRTLTVDTNHYMDFLTTAANNFKYSFQEQLLIFAQKPDATACAEVSWWNKHGRWVNRNTKGIALLVDTDAPYKLRHVFDVSDTNSRAGKEVPIWKMEQRFVEPVKKVWQNDMRLMPMSHWRIACSMWRSHSLMIIIRIIWQS